jgi:hypothetical protein
MKQWLSDWWDDVKFGYERYQECRDYRDFLRSRWAGKSFAEAIRGITPEETPFMKAMRNNSQQRPLTDQ